jgi:16S rRNA processing protein RimM
MGAHGVDGSLSIKILSDLPGRFDSGRLLFLDDQPRAVTSFRPTGPDTALISLEGFSTRRSVAPFAGRYLSALPESNPLLEEGEYYHYQLIGMQVYSADGEDLGQIQEILETGSNDVYIVRGDSGELLIPATVQVVQHVDVADNRMVVQLPDGLR